MRGWSIFKMANLFFIISVTVRIYMPEKTVDCVPDLD